MASFLEKYHSFLKKTRRKRDQRMFSKACLQINAYRVRKPCVNFEGIRNRLLDQQGVKIGRFKFGDGRKVMEIS
jgi:hypothetical protein